MSFRVSHLVTNNNDKCKNNKNNSKTRYKNFEGEFYCQSSVLRSIAELAYLKQRFDFESSYLIYKSIHNYFTDILIKMKNFVNRSN